jgi:hypothetical protein
MRQEEAHQTFVNAEIAKSHSVHQTIEAESPKMYVWLIFGLFLWLRKIG